MEEFFQYIGPDSGASTYAALLNKEKLYVYSSPREKAIDRCGDVPVGSYFACSEISYYENQCWMKIRRGYFSNTKRNGYIRVEFDFTASAGPAADLPARQRCVESQQPVQFKHLRRLPNFPTFLCARDRVVLTRLPVYDLHATSVSSEKIPHHHQRYLPRISVFHATESRFNEDFTQMAVKATSSFGMTGWINVSFHQSLIEVEDPRIELRHPVYMQNVAARTGKWAGELPVRAIPSLQAPKLYNIENLRIVEAIGRKLVKDQVWIQIRPPIKSNMETTGKNDTDVEAKTDDEHEEEEESKALEPDARDLAQEAWIIERNANSGERVTIPWGNHSIQAVPNSDEDERYYRNVYSRRALPLRKSANLSSEIVGKLEPGAVFVSTKRVLNEMGHMWIRVPLPAKDGTENQEVVYGYAIQSNAKTNGCMLREIPPPGKITATQYFQVQLNTNNSSSNSTTLSSTENPLEEDNKQSANVVIARTGSSASAKELFYIKNGAILSVIGSVYNKEEHTMWLQVLTTEIDAAMRIKQEHVVLSEEEQTMSVVYVAICDPSDRPWEPVVKPIYRRLQRIANGTSADNEQARTSTRVVFTGRASRLFGSHLLRPSTIDLPTFSKKSENDLMGPAAQAAGETQSTAQRLKEEITNWQLQSERASTLYTYANNGVTYAFSCLRRPFQACLEREDARQKYAQLHQDDDPRGDELEF